FSNAKNLTMLLEDEIPRESIETLTNLSQKFKETVKEFNENDVKQSKEHPAATFLKAEASKTTDAIRRAADGIGRRLADSASQLLETRTENRLENRINEPQVTQQMIKLTDEDKAASFGDPKKQIRKVEF